MIKTTKSPATTFVPAVEEVPVLSDEERTELRAGLEAARADIAAGNFDILTPELMQAEFKAIYYDGKSDAEVDAELAKLSGKSSKV